MTGSTTGRERTGIIGLGTMGKPMAYNLLRAGFALTVYNRSRPSVDELVQAGARSAASPGEVGAQADVVITMLPNTPQVEEVVLGPSGVTSGLAPGGVVIDMSTIAPDGARRIAAQLATQGIGMLDAPVSGGPAGAQSGTLTIMVGGEAATLERCRPVLAALGQQIYHAGDHGAGQVVKLCNNLMSAIHIAAVSEAFAMGTQAGIDPRLLYEVITHSTGSSWQLEHSLPYPGIIADAPADHDFAPRFSADLMYKDVTLALDVGRSLNVPMFAAVVTHQLFGLVRALGHGGKDFSVVGQVIRDLAGDHQQA
jgi:3-hydroxyisobutyrate dehydrogenase